MLPFHDLPPAELAALDVAEVSLRCAVGLQGAENLDFWQELAIVDRWAGQVDQATRRRWGQFLRDPSKFENSEPFFRMLVMATVLQLDCGVKYNLATLSGDIDYADSRQQFIHGILEGFGGTCATLPVLYAAIGRRLGYPLKLATAVGHMFCRWDDPSRGVRLNFEVSGRGLIARTDDEYRCWPEPMTPADEQCYQHLVSLTPRQELAEFLMRRGCCYFDCGHFYPALEHFLQAKQLWPEQFACPQWAAAAMVLHFEASGQALYGLLRPSPLPGDLVLDRGRARPMTPSERAGVALARRELARIAGNHRRRQERRQGGLPEVTVPDYPDPGQRSDHAVPQGAAICTTPT